jgi:antitoxin Phd
MSTWQLQEAKAKFSKIVKKTINDGPQTITVRGEPTVVMLSKQEYDALSSPKDSFVEFWQSSPLNNTSIDLTRDDSSDREVDL